MRMYVVTKIGSGTESDPYRPDISDDVPWAGVPAATLFDTWFVGA